MKTLWKIYVIAALGLALALAVSSQTMTQQPLTLQQPLALGPVLSGSTAVDLRTVDTILFVPGLGQITSTGKCDVQKDQTLKITAFTVHGPVVMGVEWSVGWDPNGWKQGFINAGQSADITVPWYHPFEITIARPVAKKIGWIHATINDCILVGVWMRN